MPTAFMQMERNICLVIVVFCALAWGSESKIFHPVSEQHRSAALELFASVDGHLGSLEETYEALRTFQVLGVEKGPDIRTSACASVLETLKSPSSDSKPLFHALRIDSLLNCEIHNEAFLGIQSGLIDSLHGASALLDFYYAIGSLVLLKDHTPEVYLNEADADTIAQSVKALSQSDGRWRLNSNNPESRFDAAGMAIEAIAGVISLSNSEIDQNLVAALKNDIVKLLDGIERYDDGSYYFVERLVDAHGNQSPLSVSAAVVRGIAAFAAVTPESLHLSDEKILGLAKFFLGIGVPGRAKDLYYQIDALACINNIKGSVPLILSFPATVISTNRNGQVKVKATTVLGSVVPNLSIKLAQIFTQDSKDGSVTDQKLKYDPENEVHVLETLPLSIDIGSYVFSFEITFDDPEEKRNYVTGGRTKVPIYITGVVRIHNADITILDSDSGSSESITLDLHRENAIALSANHLQKLRLSFHLSTPSQNAFWPKQAFLKLIHESGVEHIFLVGSSKKKFEIVLDFLGLVEKLFYLSGRYEIQLTLGDSVMENSLLQPLGYIDLDLPDAPEKAPRPPPQRVDLYSRYGPKPEITHLFRAPEKTAPSWLSNIFLALVIIPFLGFLVAASLGLGANIRGFPETTVSAVFALLFHVAIAAVLLLYVAFWTKLDLFTTLKALGLIGAFLLLVGHKTLSHLAAAAVAPSSSKLKSS